MAINNIVCKRCGSDEYANSGLQWRNGEKNVQRRRCKNCGYIYVLPDEHPYARVKKEVLADATSG